MSSVPTCASCHGTKIFKCRYSHGAITDADKPLCKHGADCYYAIAQPCNRCTAQPVQRPVQPAQPRLPPLKKGVARIVADNKLDIQAPKTHEEFVAAIASRSEAVLLDIQKARLADPSFKLGTIFDGADDGNFVATSTIMLALLESFHALLQDK